VTYLLDCGQGNGMAANLIIGPLSNLNSPTSAKGVIADESALSALQSTAPDGYEYVTEITGWFKDMVTIRGPHPFFAALSPNPSQYCGD
jgi:hypothetical protein